MFTKRAIQRSTTIHHMIQRSSGSGIRWSSYVGDVRCFGSTTTTSGSSSGGRRSNSSSSATAGGAPHERLLILGSGVAGCATALTAARHGIPVTKGCHCKCTYIASFFISCCLAPTNSSQLNDNNDNDDCTNTQQ